MAVTASYTWRYFSTVRTGRQVTLKGRMNASKNREIIEENLLRSAHDLRARQRFTFQHDMT